MERLANIIKKEGIDNILLKVEKDMNIGNCHYKKGSVVKISPYHWDIQSKFKIYVYDSNTKNCYAFYVRDLELLIIDHFFSLIIKPPLN